MTRQRRIWPSACAVWSLGLMLSASLFAFSATTHAADKKTEVALDQGISSAKSEVVDSSPTKATHPAPKSITDEATPDESHNKAAQRSEDSDEPEKPAVKKTATEKVEEYLEDHIELSGRMKHIIGSTVAAMETQSQLLFSARVDTGAKSCSVHYEEMEVEDEAKKMEDNVGKPVRVLINNGADESTWVESTIERCVTVKTSIDKERRYKVPMTFRVNDVEKTVDVTLNDRGHMEYPLLLGRNFLRDDFLVDAGLNDDD